MLSREFGKSGKTVDGVEKWSVVQGTTAITGPIYYYDGANPSKIKLPPQFNKKWIMSDFGAGYLNLATLDENGEKLTDVQRSVINLGLNRPVAFQVGPDGALYVVEYAAGNFTSTAETKISRIEYVGDCLPATPVLPTTALLPGSAKGALAGALMALVHPGQSIQLPAGSTGLSLFDLRGRKVWEFLRSSSSSIRDDEAVSIPAHLRSGVMQVKFSGSSL